MKITRPPAPWLHQDETRSLKTERNRLRHKAHEMNQTPQVWETFRKVRCLLKEKIKAAKQHFINKALSSSKPKEVWRVIHRILHPPLPPLRLDVVALIDTLQILLSALSDLPTPILKRTYSLLLTHCNHQNRKRKPSSCGWSHQVR